MKRCFLLFAIAALSACWSVGAQNSTDMKSNKKTLVAYFSCTGVTESAAKLLATELGCDIWRIAPATPYTAADLDWHDKRSRSSVEMSNPDSRPAMATKIDNMESYDVVFVGFPIWWYTASTIVNTFVESCNLEGKQVVLFATSGGSGIDKAVADFSKAYPKIDIRKGGMLNNATKSSVKSFVEALGD